MTKGRWRLSVAAGGAGVLIAAGLGGVTTAGAAVTRTGATGATSPVAATGPAPGTISTVIGGTGGPDPAMNVSVDACALKYANGALYFSSGAAVSKVSEATGTLTPVAGSGVAFGDDDNLPAAGYSFARPCGVAVDSAGNVLVADGYTIDAVAAKTGRFYGVAMTAGRVVAIASNFVGIAPAGSAADATMTGAVDVQLDPAGNLVIAVEGAQADHTDQEGDSQVVVVAEHSGTYYGQPMTAGKTYLIAGSEVGYQAGNGVKATGVDLGFAIGTLRFDAAGNVVLADSGGSGGGPSTTGPAIAPQVRVIAAKAGTFYGQRMKAGYIYTIAGLGTKTGNGIAATSARLNSAFGVALDQSGNVLVADGPVRVIAAKTGTFYRQQMKAGDIYTLPTLTGATGIAVDSAGNVLAAQDNFIVRMLAERTGTYYGKDARAGTFYTIAGNGRLADSGDTGPAAGAELTPFAVATSPAAATATATATTAATATATAAGSTAPSLTGVADGTARVARVVPQQTGTYFGRAMTAGHIYTVAGTGTYGISGNGGPGTSAALAIPEGVAFDAAGNLLIADAGQHEVRLVADRTGTFYGQAMTAGHIYTIAGDGTDGISGDGGLATAAELGGPQAVAAGADGNVLLLDSGWTLATGTVIRVRVVAGRTGTFYGQAMTAGHIYTIAGDGTEGYSGDGGPGTAAEIQAHGIATDRDGNLILADGPRVRVVAATAGSFYGEAMATGDIYTVAGGGTSTADGVPAAQAEITANTIAAGPGAGPTGPDGNLLFSDGGTVWMLAGQAGAYYGTTMKPGDVYQIAVSGSVDLLGDGGPASDALFYANGIAVAPWNGSLLLADGATNRIRSVAN